MRIYLLTILILALASCKLSNSKEDISTDIISNPVSPEGINEDEIAEFSFDEQVIDLGKITQGEKKQVIFEFENVGERPLYISAVDPSCGCTLPNEWTRNAISVGDRGIIDVEFNSENKIGETTAELTVVANTLPSSTILVIKANVIGPNKSN